MHTWSFTEKSENSGKAIPETVGVFAIAGS